MLTELLVVALLVGECSSFQLAVTQDAMDRCHQGVRDHRERCGEYANLPKERTRRDTQIITSGGNDTNITSGGNDTNITSGGNDTNITSGGTDTNNSTDVYPTLDTAKCLDITWGDGRQNTADNNFGNCMEMYTDATHRYITSNNVPDFYLNPYCPIGLGQGYCIQDEIDGGRCHFPDLVCGGENNGPGSTPYGDVWVAQEDRYKIRLEGRPTQGDRPGDMYDVRQVDGAKTQGDAQGVAINGVIIKGPNIAGDFSIDDAGFQLTCGGHVTPPMGNDLTPGASWGPPKYHFHKAPDCMAPFTQASKGVSVGGQPLVHAQLMGWALDGFGIYAYQEAGGLTPVVDECGGHFGPVDTGEVVYHYHARTIVPYHVACQGPALGRCAETQSGTNYCHPGCGYEVCVQPGTSETALRNYLAKWNETWLDSYTVNPYQHAFLTGRGESVTFSITLATCVLMLL